MKRIRLAIVDDSAFIRKALNRVLEEERRIAVVGTASSAEELLAHISAWRPDVITLDLSMPGMGGLAALDLIRGWRPVPVIILSTHSGKDAPLTIEALHRGAVDFIDKQQYSLVDFDALRTVLVDKIIQVTGNSLASPEPLVPSREQTPPLPLSSAADPYQAFTLLLIGASTGGPPAIQRILEDFGQGLGIPIVVVQHMPAGFTKPFAERLNTHLPMPVREAAHGEFLDAGTVYIAPTGSHLRVRKQSARWQSLLTRYPESLPHRPSVDVLFESASPYGTEVLAALLTGMGRDGAEGMLDLAQGGAYTLVQSEASCIVYGMPKAAMQLGAARDQAPLERIGPRLKELLGRTR